MDAGEYTSSVRDLINLTQNLDCFDFYSDVNNEEELGRMYIQDFEAMQVPEHLIDYIDYEAYGRDIRINDGGHFAPGGYVADNRSNFVEHYTGLDDIPDEYRISKVHARDEKEETHSILAAIKQCKEAPPMPRKETVDLGPTWPEVLPSGRCSEASGFLTHSEERRQYAGICRRTDNRHIRESGKALG